MKLLLRKKRVPLLDEAIGFGKIGGNIFGRSVPFDAPLSQKELFGDGVRAHGKIVGDLLHDVDIVHAGIPRFRPPHVLVRARHVLLAVQIVRLISCGCERAAGVGDHLCEPPRFKALRLLFEFGALFEAQRVHGNVLRRVRDRRVDARAEFLHALPRQPRDEVAVDGEWIVPCHFKGAVKIFRRVLSADRRKRLIGKALRVDTDACDAVLRADIQLLAGENVGPTRLYRVFTAVRPKRRDRRQHARKLLRLQGEGRPAADIDGAEIPDERRARDKLPPERGEIVGQILARRSDGRGDEGAVTALGGTEGERNKEVAVSGALLVDPPLSFDDAAHERNVFFGDAHSFKERLEGTPRFQLGIGKAGRTDARERAPRQRDASTLR